MDLREADGGWCRGLEGGSARMSSTSVRPRPLRLGRVELPQVRAAGRQRAPTCCGEIPWRCSGHSMWCCSHSCLRACSPRLARLPAARSARYPLLHVACESRALLRRRPPGGRRLGGAALRRLRGGRCVRRGVRWRGAAAARERARGAPALAPAARRRRRRRRYAAARKGLREGGIVQARR